MKQTTGSRIAAWGVHGLTASGVLFGAMALLAVSQGAPREALVLLLTALVIDGIDGPLARKARVAEVLPDFDGSALDLIVDYVTYVLVPVAFLYRFEMLPHNFVFLGSAIILLSSLYLFCNRNMKSRDLFFVGFPSIWNLMVFYFFILDTSQTLNAILVVIFSILTFVPVKAVHPFRVRVLRPVTVALTVAWLAESLVLLWVWPNEAPMLIAAWVLTGFYFVGLSLWRTLVGETV